MLNQYSRCDGDYDLGIVSGGVIVTDRLLSEKQEFVRRFLRGTLSAFRWFSANEKDATALMAKTFKITSDDSLLVYRSTLKSLTTDGTIPLAELLAANVERGRVRVEMTGYKRYRVSSQRFSACSL